MKAIDLIIKLQQCDPNLEVMNCTITKDGGSFKLTSINACEEIETSTGEKFISLDAGFVHEDQDYNGN